MVRRRGMSRGIAGATLGGAILLVLLGAGALWLAASTRAPQDTSGEIRVTVTADACDPDTLTVPAGRTSFRIHNASDRPLEWEILDGVMVVAERENIAPGFNAVLAERLKPGTYEITCGLLSNPRGRLQVVATAASEAQRAAPEIREFIGPLSEYRVYLSRRSTALAAALAGLSDRIAAGDVEGAKAAWLAAREPWRQMGPVSGRIADLANSMDPLAAYLAAREQDPAFTGFHRIEYGLWQQGSTDGLGPVAAKLAADAGVLKDRLRALELAPGDLADNASAFAGRVVDQARGGQAPYSQSDLPEFLADLDGIAKSALLVDPLLVAADPQGSAALHQALDTARSTLEGFRTAGAFPPYDQVDTAGRERIAEAFSAVNTAAAAINPAIGLE